MSVLIKGMEMPTSCARCPMLEGDNFYGLCHAASRWFDDEYWTWYAYSDGDVDESKPLNCPIEEFPKDTVPVIHGKWKPHKTMTGKNWWECSVCGFVSEHKVNHNYCPYCGAKMDEVTK